MNVLEQIIAKADELLGVALELARQEILKAVPGLTWGGAHLALIDEWAPKLVRLYQDFKDPVQRDLEIRALYAKLEEVVNNA